MFYKAQLEGLFDIRKICQKLLDDPDRVISKHSGIKHYISRSSIKAIVKHCSLQILSCFLVILVILVISNIHKEFENPYKVVEHMLCLYYYLFTSAKARNMLTTPFLCQRHLYRHNSTYETKNILTTQDLNR